MLWNSSKISPSHFAAYHGENEKWCFYLTSTVYFKRINYLAWIQVSWWMETLIIIHKVHPPLLKNLHPIFFLRIFTHFQFLLYIHILSFFVFIKKSTYCMYFIDLVACVSFQTKITQNSTWSIVTVKLDTMNGIKNKIHPSTKIF